jgi:hypothetical protein
VGIVADKRVVDFEKRVLSRLEAVGRDAASVLLTTPLDTWAMRVAYRNFCVCPFYQRLKSSHVHAVCAFY